MPTALEVLGDEEAHLRRYEEASWAGLAAAAAAAAGLAGELVVEFAPSDAAPLPRKRSTAIGDIANGLALRLVGELRKELRACFATDVRAPAPTAPSERESREDLLERLRAAYRESKADALDQISDQAILEAGNRALRQHLPDSVDLGGARASELFAAG